MIYFTSLPEQYAEIANDVESDIIDCLRECSYIGGRFLERFERNLCNYLNINHVIGMSSGTDALMLTLEALNIGFGDYVLIPNNACIADAFGITRAGATPIFIDINPDTFLMDAEHAETMLKTFFRRKKIKAILLVDSYGQQPDMEKFQDLALKYNIYLIEDASHAIGSTYNGRHVGSHSDVAISSFYPTKSLGTIGQGGAIMTNDTIIAKKIRTNISQFYEENYQLDSLMAIQLYHSIKKIDVWNEKRKIIANIYNDNFTAEQRPTQQPCSRHIYHLYEFKCKSSVERDRVEKGLSANQIGYGFHYPLISDTPIYINSMTVETPIASMMRDRIISLPIHPYMTTEQAIDVVLYVQGIAS